MNALKTVRMNGLVNGWRDRPTDKQKTDKQTVDKRGKASWQGHRENASEQSLYSGMFALQWII